MNNKDNENTISYPTSQDLNSDFMEEYGEVESDILDSINEDLCNLTSKQKSNEKTLGLLDLKKLGKCLGRVLGVAKSRGFFNQLFSKGMSPVRRSIEAFLKCTPNPQKIKKYMEMINKLKNSVKSESKSQLMRLSSGLRNNNWARFIIFISSNELTLEINVSKKIFGLDDSLENVMSIKTDTGDDKLIKQFKNNVYNNVTLLQKTIKEQSIKTENKLKGLKT